MFFAKIIYILIFLTVANFIIGIWTQNSSDNTLLRLNKDGSLDAYIVSSARGDTYLFSSLVRQHLSDLRSKKANVYFSYNNELEKQPYFRKIFSDGVAEITLYPHKLKQNIHHEYILTDQEYGNLAKEEWIEKKGRNVTFFLPKIKSCNQYKIMIYKDINVFLFPLCLKFKPM
jgi:hypothetical protein